MTVVNIITMFFYKRRFAQLHIIKGRCGQCSRTILLQLNILSCDTQNLLQWSKA